MFLKILRHLPTGDSFTQHISVLALLRLASSVADLRWGHAKYIRKTLFLKKLPAALLTREGGNLPLDTWLIAQPSYPNRISISTTAESVRSSNNWTLRSKNIFAGLGLLQILLKVFHSFLLFIMHLIEFLDNPIDALQSLPVSLTSVDLPATAFQHQPALVVIFVWFIHFVASSSPF